MSNELPQQEAGELYADNPELEKQRMPEELGRNIRNAAETNLGALERGDITKEDAKKRIVEAAGDEAEALLRDVK